MKLTETRRHSLLNLHSTQKNKNCLIKVARFQLDGMYNMDTVEYSKKRKLQSDQLDLLRPKHKCWAGGFCSEHASMFDENPILKSMHDQMVEIRTYAPVLDDTSQPESAKDSNSFVEDSDTAMSVNKEAKLDEDCANTYLYVKKVSHNDKDMLVDSEYNPSYHGADVQALNDTEEHLLELENFSGHLCSEYAKDRTELSVDEEFEDFLFSSGVNPNMYVLSSGRWNVNQEAQSSTRPPTIDQEFEEYFSSLML